MLHLRHGGDAPATHLLAHADGRLVGYAHVDPTDAVEGPSAELCVHPLLPPTGTGPGAGDRGDGGRGGARPVRRGCGCGHTATTRRPTRWRSRSASPVPGCCGRCAGRCSRRCRCSDPAGRGRAARVPARCRRRGLARSQRPSLRRPPRPGQWTIDDLHVRLAEAWFDPAGFLLAERVGSRTDSCWASTGPRCTALDRMTSRTLWTITDTTTTRSARCTCSGWTRQLRGSGWAPR